MHVNVNVVLDENETFTMDPNDAAAAILDLFPDTDGTQDYCSVIITSSTRGQSGYIAPPPPVEDSAPIGT